MLEVPAPIASAAPAPAASNAEPPLPAESTTIPLARAAFVCLIWFAGCALLATRVAALYDADSYFHLAVARLYREHGLVSGLPWARFSLMHEAYGDKELLFHLLLVPFVSFGNAELGGKLALALLNALLAASIGRIAARAFGGAGWLAPLILYSSGSFALRALRLRPELLSVLLLIWVIWALSSRRLWLAAALSAAFALAHTAFHSLLGLSLAWLAWAGLVERRVDLRETAAVVAGVVAGVVAHPHFPQNLGVFWVQNVDFFRYKASLDVGDEIMPHTTGSLFQLDALWLLALACVWASRRPAAAHELERRAASRYGLAALAFGLLFAQAGRFASHFIPLATLACAFGLRASGFELGPNMRGPGGRESPRWMIFAFLLSAGLINAAATMYVNVAMAGAADPRRHAELEAFGRSLPAGARVAASWSDAELFAFFAPQARYLDVLDPVFMRVANPRAYAAWARIVSGEEPDVPFHLLADLDSEYVAVSALEARGFVSRLRNDPRVELLREGAVSAFRVRAGRNADFVLDWSVSGAHPGSSPPYPRAASERLRAVEGYVDATRVGGLRDCTRFRHERVLEHAETHLFELTGTGATSLAVDGKPVATFAAPSGARLGQGVGLSIALEPGAHRFTVRTCPAAGGAGFYLLDRSAR